MINLSILDFGFIAPPKLHSYQTLNSLFNEILIYEELGYKRFWLSEHFSSEFAWFSPEMLLPLLAGYSNSIKIGWAGVLLNYHNPLLVASNIRLLSSVFNDRIDLGVASAPISKKYHDFFEDRKLSWNESVDQLNIFCKGIYNDEDVEIHIPPQGTCDPSLWYLSTSQKHFDIAIKNRMNMALSFMHPGSDFTNNIDSIKIYKEKFFREHSYFPETIILIPALPTNAKRIVNLLEKKYSIKGFSGLFGEAEYIAEKLYQFQNQFDNNEFCIYNPYCNRDKRVQCYTDIMEKIN